MAEPAPVIRYVAHLPRSPPRVSLAGMVCLMATAYALLCGSRHAEAQEASQPRPPEHQARYTISHWQGPKRCRDQQHFRALLDQALGPAEGPTGAAPMQVSIRIKKRGGNFHLSLATEGEAGRGSRKLHAPQCEELLATAAVIISLALQPDLLFQNESEHQVVTASSALRQVTDDEQPLYGDLDRQGLLYVDSSAKSYLRIAVSLAAVGDVGTLPRPAVGFAVVASAHSRHYRLAFRLTQWAEQRRYVSSFEPDRGGHFDYLSGSLDLCRNVWTGAVIAGVCAVGGLGRLKGTSIMIDQPIDQAHIMATAGSGLFFEVPTGGASSLRVQGELGAQLLRPDYSAEVLDENDDRKVVKVHIHQPALLAARLAVSWGLTF